jgi:hypothetical protein
VALEPVDVYHWRVYVREAVMLDKPHYTVFCINMEPSLVIFDDEIVKSPPIRWTGEVENEMLVIASRFRAATGVDLV